MKVLPDTQCSLTTYKKFDSTFCSWDLENYELNIYGAFSQVPFYLGTIVIDLDNVQIPENNKKLQPMVVQTFDDSNKMYPIDMLEVDPLLQCHYPCKLCAGGDRKNDCSACWLDDDEVNQKLMPKENSATCQAECDAGWTTNGSVDKKCVRCDPMCATCRDNGIEND